MLSKQNKISRKTFLNIFKKGLVIFAPNISLRYFKTNKENNPKFSFVVSKAVDKKAVNRNLLKRRGYSIARKHIKKIKNNCFFIFFFKKGAVKLSFKDLEEEIVYLLKKSKTL